MWDRKTQFLHENINVASFEGRRFMSELSESDKLNISDKLVSALYKSAVDKFPAIDFGEIPNSKGDISRLKHFDMLQESINLIQDIIKETNRSLPEIDTISDSLKIVQAYKKEFCLSYIQDKAVGIMLYNAVVLGIICGTNMCISTIIDFIRTPGGSPQESMKIQSKANGDSRVLITNLEKFNEAASSGELRKFLGNIIEKENFIGGIGAITIASGVSIGAIAVASAILFIPIMRELIYFFYNFRMSVSEYFKTQSEFLEINLAELRNSDIKNKAKIIKQHEKRIAQLEKISNTFEVKFNDSNKKTKKELSHKVDPKTAQIALGSEIQLM